MATEVQRLWFAVPAEARVDGIDEELARDCEELLAGGPVSFDFSTRAAAPSLPRPKRLTVAVYRCVPEPFYVPPDLNVKECVFDVWADAVRACETADDQILVRARNRFFRRGEVARAICCRPKDETDKKRFLTLQAVFGRQPPADSLDVEDAALLLVALDGRLTQAETRLLKLEAKGTRCAPGSAV